MPDKKDKEETVKEETIKISDHWRYKIDEKNDLCLQCFSKAKNAWLTKEIFHCDFYK